LNLPAAEKSCFVRMISNSPPGDAARGVLVEISEHSGSVFKAGGAVNTLLIIKILGLIVGAIAAVRGKRGDPNSPREKRLTVAFVMLGFGAAVVAELVSASQSQTAAALDKREADTLVKRNSACSERRSRVPRRRQRRSRASQRRQ